MGETPFTRRQLLQHNIGDFIYSQFLRRTWAQRLYRLAVLIDGRPDTYIRIREADTLRVILPQPRFGPDVIQVQTASQDGEVIGGLTREKLKPEDIPRPGFCLADQSSKEGWKIREITPGFI